MNAPANHYEDYLERIFEITSETGNVRAIDLAERLGVSKGSVSQMLTRLERDGYINREHYRGFSLTPLGKKTALNIRKRHQVLEEFLELLHIPDSVRENDIEGLEHSLSETTLTALESLVNYLKKHRYRK